MWLIMAHRSQIFYHGWVIQGLFGRVAAADDELRVRVAGGPLIRWWHAAPDVKRIPYSSIEVLERTHRLVLIRLAGGDELICRDEFLVDLPRVTPFPLIDHGADAAAALTALRDFRKRQRNRPPSSWSGGIRRSYWSVFLRISLPVPLVLATAVVATLLI